MNEPVEVNMEVTKANHSNNVEERRDIWHNINSSYVAL